MKNEDINLLNSYERSIYVSSQEYDRLEQLTGIERKKIMDWFSQKRSKAGFKYDKASVLSVDNKQSLEKQMKINSLFNETRIKHLAEELDVKITDVTTWLVNYQMKKPERGIKNFNHD